MTVSTLQIWLELVQDTEDTNAEPIMPKASSYAKRILKEQQKGYCLKNYIKLKEFFNYGFYEYSQGFFT